VTLIQWPSKRVNLNPIENIEDDWVGEKNLTKNLYKCSRIFLKRMITGQDKKKTRILEQRLFPFNPKHADI